MIVKSIIRSSTSHLRRLRRLTTDRSRSGPSAVSPILAKAPRYRRGLASVHGERLSARRARGRCRDSTRSLRLTVSRKPKEREGPDEFAEPLAQVQRRRVVLFEGRRATAPRASVKWHVGTSSSTSSSRPGPCHAL